MPLPEEVIDSWKCSPPPDDRQCRPVWISCDDCDGEPGPDDKCDTCTGCGGGYVCSPHDTDHM